MIDASQLSSGVTTQSPPVVWLTDPKVTTVRRRPSGKGQKTSKRGFQASLLHIANSPSTVWHDFTEVCKTAGL